MRKTPNFSGVSLSRLFGVISEHIGAVFIFRAFDRECAVFYIMIYGCDDAFFKQKEPWSYKPWLENFAEFTTLR